MFSFNHKFFKLFKSILSSMFSMRFLNLFLLFTLLFSPNIAYCFDRSFAWDANTEPDIAGYNFYYKNGDSGAPYDGTGADEGNSPIQIPLASLNDPSNPHYTIHGLSDTETYFFVITAYDIYNNESGYSVELCKASGPTPPQYDLTVGVSGSYGKVSPTSGTYPAGTVVKLTAFPDNGHRVAAWSGTNDDSSTSNTNTVTMNDHKTVTVEFEEIPIDDNVVVNPGFESGKSPWSFYTNGTGSFNISSSSAYEGVNAVHITLATTGTNMQFNQTNISLEPNTEYEIRFAAYSKTGHDLQLFLHKNTSPYTNYGLANQLVNLTTSWAFYTISFTTDNFSEPVDDARLRFWFVNSASNGDEYWIDNVELCKAYGSPPPKYDLTVGVSGSYGTVSPTSGTYPAGTVVKLTAFPDTGHRVAAWSGTNDDSSTSNTNTVTMNDHKTVTVEFEEIPIDDNVVVNPGFESGKSPWSFYTNGTGSFTVTSPAYEGSSAAHISTVTAGTNIQFYQADLPLKPNTDYELSFCAYSNTDHDLRVMLIQHVFPYSDYGLSRLLVNLTTNWNTYKINFKTNDFASPVKDARLSFWLATDANAGDEYWIDDVILIEAH